MSRLGAPELRRAMTASLDALRAQRTSIDAANVYPVPDGDTGTNLVMTFESVTDALRTTAEAGAAHAVKTGSLKGARGNAGVIMAQILRGWAEAVEDGPADVEQMARAFKRSVELAYEAVLEPAEGTILTVARAASDAAQGEHPSVAAQFAAAARAAAEALTHTPEQLPVLRRAGVVDAGGMGLVAVLAAFARALGSGDVPAAPAGPSPERAPADLCDGEPLGYAYEVQYMLAGPDDRIPALRQLLGTIGDSVAVVGGGGTWRVHVHTDDRDRAVAIGSAVGETSDVEIVDFAAQIEASRRAPGETVKPSEPVPGERGLRVARADATSTLLVVASGEGVRELFEGLGAIVLDGGENMRADPETVLDAIESAPTADVIVLPNHEDLFFTAHEVAGRSARRVTVLRTTDVGEGLAAALAYGDARAAEVVVSEMRAALERVRTGMVVLAPMVIPTPLGNAITGQAIGFVGGATVTIEDDPVLAARAVADSLLARGGSVLTVLAGKGCDDVERSRLAAALQTLPPAVATEIHHGGQPMQRYVLSVE